MRFVAEFTPLSPHTGSLMTGAGVLLRSCHYRPAEPLYETDGTNAVNICVCPVLLLIRGL